MDNQKGGQKFVNTVLSLEQAQEFELVKAYLGIATNSDVVRYLIRQEARRLGLETKPAPAPAA